MQLSPPFAKSCFRSKGAHCTSITHCILICHTEDYPSTFLQHVSIEKPLFSRVLGAERPLFARVLCAEKPLLASVLGAERPLFARLLSAERPLCAGVWCAERPPIYLGDSEVIIFIM